MIGTTPSVASRAGVFTGCGTIARPRLKAIATVLVGLRLTLVLPAAAPAAPGDLDPTFGRAGKVLTPIGNSNDHAFALALQPDGKLVAAGYTFDGAQHRFGLARYGADGSLDATFGTGGKVSSALGQYAFAIALQPDGRILVGGDIFGGTGVARYDADGAADTSFGTGGVVASGLGQIRALLVQADGRIIAVGTSSSGAFAAARYESSGVPDGSFGTGGVASVDSPTPLLATSGALDASGKLVIAGSSFNGTDEDIAVARLDSDGALDAGFGNGGVVTAPLGPANDIASAVVIQPDGKVVVAGGTFNGVDYDIALVRCEADGTLDTSFGTGGAARNGIGSEGATSLLLQPDGKLVAVGNLTLGAEVEWILARFLPDGTPDATFGLGGLVTTEIRLSPDFADAAVLQPDGNVVVAGQSQRAQHDGDFALARFLHGSDSLVLPPRPLKVAVPQGQAAIETTVRVKVRNGDAPRGGPAPDHEVMLAASDGDCPPGTVASQPDFDDASSGSQSSIAVRRGRSKTAKLRLSLSSTFASYNPLSPHRCHVQLTTSSVFNGGNEDPFPHNNSAALEIDVLDENDAAGTVPLESLVQSPRPVALRISRRATSVSRTIAVSVTNADVLPMSPDHPIAVAVDDGDCPPGTIGAVDFDPILVGAQSTAIMPAGATQIGTLTITAARDGFFSPNAKSPDRCVASIIATGPVDPDANPTNNVTDVVIDVADANDY